MSYQYGYLQNGQFTLVPVHDPSVYGATSFLPPIAPGYPSAQDYPYPIMTMPLPAAQMTQSQVYGQQISQTMHVLPQQAMGSAHANFSQLAEQLQALKDQGPLGPDPLLDLATRIQAAVSAGSMQLPPHGIMLALGEDEAEPQVPACSAPQRDSATHCTHCNHRCHHCHNPCCKYSHHSDDSSRFEEIHDSDTGPRDHDALAVTNRPYSTTSHSNMAATSAASSTRAHSLSSPAIVFSPQHVQPGLTSGSFKCNMHECRKMKFRTHKELYDHVMATHHRCSSTRCGHYFDTVAEVLDHRVEARH
ncbi:hypothetical protein BXZ70DRAFT_10099 [Cristinia sonorae]|uniref:C2H2-type domain-containing protein n=1 Tax=Cristinia sonorae TaxID=1940300 RepID=A0A8K0V1A6_9AGAR|nr:hypothetical protein BXZ70DRAFT_10099 [Cristinia sonorae]